MFLYVISTTISYIHSFIEIYESTHEILLLLDFSLTVKAAPRRHCVVSLSKNINPSLVLVQPRKTCPFITERLLMGRKVSNQTNKQTKATPHKCVIRTSQPEA